MRPEVENPEEVNRPKLPPGALAVLVLGAIGAVIFGMRDCSRTSESTSTAAPPAITNALPEPIVTQTVAVATAASQDEANDDAQDLTELLAAFDRYALLLRQGEFETASNALHAIEAKLTTANLQTNFWLIALPEATRATLTLASVCLACADGQCWTCNGKGLCATCEGSGICTLCEGNSARVARCTACRCIACRGGGKCGPCVGQGLVRCGTCQGNGTAATQKRVACAPCNGTGQRTGLRRANGTSTRQPCLTCSGAGYRMATQLATCQVCAGKGRIACPSCNATGNCKVCNGQGRTQPCTVCNSTGQIRIDCPRCAGSGQCDECNGTKRCHNCGGNGSCPKCGGNGVVRHLSLPVDTRWLTQSHGYVVVDTKTGARLSAGASSGSQQLLIEKRKLVFPVGSNEMLWISTDGSFVRAREAMAPQ